MIFFNREILLPVNSTIKQKNGRMETDVSKASLVKKRFIRGSKNSQPPISEIIQRHRNIVERKRYLLALFFLSENKTIKPIVKLNNNAGTWVTKRRLGTPN